MESQLEIGQEVLVTIKSIGINGEGVGFYKRQVVFVTDAIPPEQVVVRVVDLKKGYAVGEPVRFKKHAYYRRRPFCRHYGTCGGCQLQHADYEEQLRLKQELLKQTIERYADLQPGDYRLHRYEPPLNPRAYRHKAQMPVENTSDGLQTGLYARGGKEFVPVAACPVQHPRINETNQAVLEILDRYRVYAFDPSRMRGMLRYIVTRIGSSRDEIQVTLVVTLFNKFLHKVAREILELPNVVGVAVSKNHDAANPNVFGETYEVLAGREVIDERLGGVRYALNPKAFFQLNPLEAKRMYDYVGSLLPRGESLLDLHTGSGGMALYFADRFKQVVGIDSDPSSISSAEANARANGMEGATFRVFDAGRYLKRTPGASFDVVVMDPPRSGLDRETISGLLASPPQTLIYVSCNPSTLAKDLGRLKKQFCIESIKPFDMFPQTSQVESVTHLSRRKETPS